MMKIKTLFSLIFVLLADSLCGQENIDSPASVFGIGDIQLMEGGRTAGMASAALSLSGSYFLNTTNPAALSHIDSTNFIFDIVISSRKSQFSYRNLSEKAFSANVTRIATGFRFSKRLAGAVSFKPYSTVSYHIDKYITKEGTDSKVLGEYEGSGGINQLSLLNSYKITNKLSLGSELMYLYGTINRTTELEGVNIIKESVTHTFSFSTGMLYRDKLNDNLDLSAALVYGSGNSFRFKNTMNILDIEGNNIFFNKNASSDIKIPQSIGAGISVSGSRLLVSTDYYFRKKMSSLSDNSGIRFADTKKINFGLAFIPVKYPANYFEAIEYQAGFSFSNSYQIQNGINPHNVEVSAGAALPIRGNSQLNLAFSWGRRGIERTGIIREDYFRVSLGFSLVDRMFIRSLYY
ncbi:MAG TPA: hypothetical protein VHO46_06000 [Bacteroidales bacterium]|nr:hypothetical protein [Bacteroidales bacterium]